MGGKSSSLAKQGSTNDHRKLWFFACSDGDSYGRYKLESWDDSQDEYEDKSDQLRWFSPPKNGHPCAVAGKTNEFHLGGISLPTDSAVTPWFRVSERLDEGTVLAAECNVTITDWPKRFAGTWYFGEDRGLYFWDGSAQAVDPGRTVMQVVCNGDQLA